MVTQREYSTNFQTICDTIGIDHDELEDIMGSTKSYLWGPTKEYAYRKPDGKPFISNVIHIKSPHDQNETACYASRSLWYYFLTTMGFMRFRLSPEETAVRIAEYTAMTRKTPDIEVPTDQVMQIHCLDVYLCRSTRKEIQILGITSK
jgi:hypothetical protein